MLAAHRAPFTAVAQFPMDGEGIPPELILLTCTEQCSGGCQLRRHLTYCNQVLWHSGLQLGEDPGDEPGYLNVATVPGMCRDFPYCENCARNEKPALVMLQWLLKKHSCIVSLEANYGTVHATTALVEAIASSSNLLRLAIFDTAADPPEVAEQPQGHDNAFAFLEDYNTCTARMDIPIALLLKDDARIVSLDLSKLKMGPSTTEKLIDALLKNGTVEELSIGADTITSDRPIKSFNLFVAFLLKENATLRKLSITGSDCLFHINACSMLGVAIASLRTLENLILEVNATKKECVLFLEAVFRSQSLRSLTFLPGTLSEYDRYCGSRENVNAQSWIFALQNNRVMQMLDLDINWLSSGDCCFLLDAIGRKSNPTAVTLRNYNEGLKDVCRIIGQAGLNERIRIEARALVSDEGDDLMACEQLVSVYLGRSIFASNPFSAYNVFHVVTTCSHITSVCVLFQLFYVDIFPSLAACILESSTLREIMVDVDCTGIDDVDSDVLSQSLGNVYSALYSNTSLNKIEITSSYFSSECTALADAPSNNRHLHEFRVLGMEEEDVEAFLDSLLTRLDQNYNLLLLDVPFCLDTNDQMRAAQEIVRRNRSLVERATRFVMGTHHRDFACAFEILSEEPVLLMNVRKKATVSEQAESMVNEARNLLRNANLNTYMRLAGVVKRAVQCKYREDGGRQLDRLPYDCWVPIRRHLKIADVVEP
ncbi:hypothetical protein HPB50_021671 [Hyalomma asiaticum]|uniref:Uncharacterized protein n=1 Tax=Hyalomma asiaticum TaxID=266040 RepID=A0ACB7TBA9_HYAAI|nr:hypothetical protein HPB50_021671 [Hyalomma asiaticum]